MQQSSTLVHVHRCLPMHVHRRVVAWLPRCSGAGHVAPLVTRRFPVRLTTTIGSQRCSPMPFRRLRRTYPTLCARLQRLRVLDSLRPIATLRATAEIPPRQPAKMKSRGPMWGSLPLTPQPIPVILFCHAAGDYGGSRPGPNTSARASSKITLDGRGDASVRNTHIGPDASSSAQVSAWWSAPRRSRPVNWRTKSSIALPNRRSRPPSFRGPPAPVGCWLPAGGGTGGR